MQFVRTLEYLLVSRHNPPTIDVNSSSVCLPVAVRCSFMVNFKAAEGIFLEVKQQ